MTNTREIGAYPWGANIDYCIIKLNEIELYFKYFVWNGEIDNFCYYSVKISRDYKSFAFESDDSPYIESYEIIGNKVVSN